MPNIFKRFSNTLKKAASKKASNIATANENQALGVPIRALDKTTFVSKSANKKKSLTKANSAKFGGRRTRTRKHRHTRKCKH